MSDYDSSPPDDGGRDPGPAPAAPAPAEPARPATLDDVYRTHKIEDDAQRYKQDEFRPLPVVQREDGQEILQVLNAATNELNLLREERRTNGVQSDIDRTVAAVEKETGVDPDIIEAYMENLARKDSRFKTVWDGRKVDPVRFNAAINALTNQIADKYQPRGDPDLLANQKAMRAYQSGSSTRASSDERGWDNLTQSDFNRKWSSLIS